MRDEPRALDEIEPVHVPRAVREDLTRLDAHYELGLRILGEQRVALVE